MSDSESDDEYVPFCGSYNSSGDSSDDEETSSEQSNDDRLDLEQQHSPPENDLSTRIPSFSCFFCNLINFSKEEDLQAHFQTSHKDVSTYYHYKTRKCRRCRTSFKSLSLLGLVAHVAAKTCTQRKARLMEKLQFLQSLSLRPMQSSLLRICPWPVPPPAEQRPISTKKSTTLDPSSTSIKRINKKPALKRNNNGGCDSFLCKSSDRNVKNFCKTCQNKERRKQASKIPFFSRSISKPNTNTNRKKKQASPTIKKKKNIKDFSEYLTYNENEDFLRLISSSRESAVKANLVNCRRTVRKAQRSSKKARQDQIRQMKEKSNKTNSPQTQIHQQQIPSNKPVPLRGKLVMKINKQFWNEVKEQYSNSSE